MLKGKDILDFVLKNRRGKAFAGFSTFDIMSTIQDSDSVNGLGMVVNDNNQLIALAIGFPYENSHGKFLHIHSILTARENSQGGLKALLKLFLQRFPGFTISARRKGKFSVYSNTPKLLKRLWVTSDKQ